MGCRFQYKNHHCKYPLEYRISLINHKNINEDDDESSIDRVFNNVAVFNNKRRNRIRNENYISSDYHHRREYQRERGKTGWHRYIDSRVQQDKGYLPLGTLPLGNDRLKCSISLQKEVY